MDRRSHRDEIRPAGNLVAVNVGGGEIGADQAIAIFEECGALQVEQADGTWSDGEWSDFDPTDPPHLVHAAGEIDRRTSAP
jgi:hypothetical protein